MTALERQLLSQLPKDKQDKIDWVELIGTNLEIFYKDGSDEIIRVNLYIN